MKLPTQVATSTKIFQVRKYQCSLLMHRQKGFVFSAGCSGMVLLVSAFKISNNLMLNEIQAVPQIPFPT